MTQGSFQTGIYDIRYVHNDWIQFFLDIGWFPGLAIIWAVIRSLFSRKLSKTRKMILGVLVLHGMMDFNMQYLYLGFILLLVMDFHAEAESRFTKAIVLPGIVCAAAGIYIGLGNFAYYSGDMNMAKSLYPYNTFVDVVLLQEAEIAEEMEVLAEKILARNSHVAIAWNAKARAAYSRGEFDDMMDDMHQAMACKKYDLAIYEDYFDMLKTGVELYRQEGYTESAEICLEEIKKIQVYLDEVRNSTSDLAWKLRDVPELEMDESYGVYLQQEENSISVNIFKNRLLDAV